MYVDGPTSQVEQGAIVEHPVFQDIYPHSLVLVLTPKCDIEQGKSEFLTLCPVLPPADLFARRDWEQKGTVRNEFGNVASYDKAPRWYWLWQAIEYEGFGRGALLDFQLVASVEEGTFDDATFVTAVASPWREDIGARYAAYAGRVGVPDPPADLKQLQRDIVLDFGAGQKALPKSS